MTDPAGNTTRFSYYQNRKLQTMTDPNGNVTSWTIDWQGRVTGKTSADGGTSQTIYEATTSRLHAIVDALGQTRQYGYYDDNRLASVQYASINPTPSVGFTYDTGFPRLTSMTDGFGTTSYSYVPPGALGALRLSRETPPFANSAIAYGYDTLGRLASRSVGGDAETLAYDALGRVTAHGSDLGTFQRFYLDQTAQPIGQRNGPIGTRWFYDSNLNDRRLTGIATSGASHFSYATTPERDITQITESRKQQVWSYNYDQADRLLQATSSLGTQYGYGYDPGGNLGVIQTPAGVTAIQPAPANEVASPGPTPTATTPTAICCPTARAATPGTARTG